MLCSSVLTSSFTLLNTDKLVQQFFIKTISLNFDSTHDQTSHLSALINGDLVTRPDIHQLFLFSVLGKHFPVYCSCFYSLHWVCLKRPSGFIYGCLSFVVVPPALLSMSFMMRNPHFSLFFTTCGNSHCLPQSLFSVLSIWHANFPCLTFCCKAFVYYCLQSHNIFWCLINWQINNYSNNYNLSEISQ